MSPGLMATPIVVPASPPPGSGCSSDSAGDPAEPTGPSFQSCLDGTPGSTDAQGPADQEAFADGSTTQATEPGAGGVTAATPPPTGSPATGVKGHVKGEKAPKAAKTDDPAATPTAAAPAPDGPILVTESPAPAIPPIPVAAPPAAPTPGAPPAAGTVPAAAVPAPAPPAQASTTAVMALGPQPVVPDPAAASAAEDASTVAATAPQPAVSPASVQAAQAAQATTSAGGFESSTIPMTPPAAPAPAASAAPTALPPKKADDVVAASAPWAETKAPPPSATATTASAPAATAAASGQDVSPAAAPPAPTATAAEAASIPVVISSRLEHLAATARAVMQTSARTGISRARIELRPPELGHVEIRLRYSSDGVKATITAANPAAVQALGSSTGDLRRALEAHGLTVLGLDVGLAGSGDGHRPDGDPQTQLSRPSAAPVDGEDTDPDGQDLTTTSTVRIPAAGSSVDVLA